MPRLSFNSPPDLPFLIKAGSGDIDGFSIIEKFGRNPDIDTATVPEDVWNGGGAYTGFPTESETLEVFSASANDAAAGTGARTLRVQGLDASGNITEEDFTLNGVTGVTGSKTFNRVARAWVLTAGSTGSNVGAITIRHSSTTANIFAVLPATFGQTLIAAYTVPADRIAYLVGFDASITRASGTAGSGTIAIQTNDGSAWRSRQVYEIQTGAAIVKEMHATVALDAGTDIRVRVTSVSDNNTIVTSQFELLMVENG